MFVLNSNTSINETVDNNINGTTNSNESGNGDDNIYTVLINLTNKTFDLLSVGKILSAFFLVLLLILSACSIIIISKYPVEDLPNLINKIGTFITSINLYMILSIILNFILAIALFVNRKINHSEIQRLSREKSELQHGLENGQYNSIPKINSSQRN